jgi:hemoglobin
MMQELEVYSMIGAEGFTRLVAAFYRQVPQDNLLGPMYPAQDLSGAEQRLRDFLIGRFRGAAQLHRTKRPPRPARAAFSVPYKSGRPRSMDALDE